MLRGAGRSRGQCQLGGQTGMSPFPPTGSWGAEDEGQGQGPAQHGNLSQRRADQKFRLPVSMSCLQNPLDKAGPR